MKVMFELDTNDIKKILNFVCYYIIENEGAIEKLEAMLDTLKSSAEEAKEADNEILNQVKDFVGKRTIGEFGNGLHEALTTLVEMNSVIVNKGRITVWEFVEYLDGRAAADDLEASYELLNNYGWREVLAAENLIANDGKFSIDPDTIVRLD